jgi:hypothetical protein
MACISRNPNGLTGDCPAPTAVTGQSKCFKGTNVGMNCTTGADCPGGGTCALFIGDIPIALNPLTTGTSTLSNAQGTFCPSQTTSQKGAFRSDICVSGTNSGKPCTSATATADCGAGVSCRAGTLNNYCVGGTNDGKGCVLSTDCGGGTCGKAGAQVQLIRALGTPAGPLTLNTALPIKLASAFCVAATTNPTVNANANLPGPGATILVGSITLLP